MIFNEIKYELSKWKKMENIKSEVKTTSPNQMGSIWIKNQYSLKNTIFE